jgi:hypothetical protein
MAGFFDYEHADPFDLANYDDHSVEYSGIGKSVLYHLHTHTALLSISVLRLCLAPAFSWVLRSRSVGWTGWSSLYEPAYRLR